MRERQTDKKDKRKERDKERGYLNEVDKRK